MRDIRLIADKYNKYEPNLIFEWNSLVFLKQEDFIAIKDLPALSFSDLKN